MGGIPSAGVRINGCWTPPPFWWSGGADNNNTTEVWPSTREGSLPNSFTIYTDDQPVHDSSTQTSCASQPSSLPFHKYRVLQKQQSVVQILTRTQVTAFHLRNREAEIIESIMERS